MGFEHAWDIFFKCNLFSRFSLPLGSFLSNQQGNTSSFLKHQLQESAWNQTMPSGFCRQPGQVAPSLPKSAELLSCLLLSSQKRAQGLQASQKLYLMHICLQKDDLGTWIHLLSERECWHSKHQTKTRKSPQIISSTWPVKCHLKGDNSALEASPAVRFLSAWCNNRRQHRVHQQTKQEQRDEDPLKQHMDMEHVL